MKKSVAALTIMMVMGTTASAIYLVNRNKIPVKAANAITSVRQPGSPHSSDTHSRRGDAGVLKHDAQHEHSVSQPVNSVKGRVLDHEGVAVPDVTVYAQKENVLKGILPSATTDESGDFLIEDLTPGVYKVYAVKEEAGYPPPFLSFYSGGADSVARVTVGEGEMPDVIIQLPPPSAMLTGRITDITMNKPVGEARVTLRRADNPDQFLITAPNISGNFRILVPTVPFTVEVSAPGHKTNRLGLLHLKRNEKKEIPVQLIANK